MCILCSGGVIHRGCVQALPYFSHSLEGFSLALKREADAKQKLTEACKARDAACQEAEKAREEATSLGLKVDVVNNQLLEALEKARVSLERERKVEAESAARMSELSSQLKQERAELSKVRSLLSAEGKTSPDLRAKLASAEEAAAAATADFEYAAETIDREVSGHMQAIVEVVAERLNLQLDWNSFAPAARERYEVILRASQVVPMTPGSEAAPGTPLPDFVDNLSTNPAVDPPAPSSDPSGAVPSSLPGPPADAPLPSSGTPAGAPLPPGPPSAAPLLPFEPPSVAPSAPPSAHVGEGSSVKLTSTSS
jgi:molecular chaperone GrpE (heat shock protein)